MNVDRLAHVPVGSREHQGRPVHPPQNRQLPPVLEQAMNGRPVLHLTPPPPRQPGEVRQIPGTERAIVTVDNRIAGVSARQLPGSRSQ